jgi:hypothetical protein
MLLPSVPILSACTPASQADVRAAAQHFQTAVRNGDVQAACGMLADEARSSLERTSARSCPDALTALHLRGDRPIAVQVWGDDGQARLPGGALFLARFGQGWKITGAGCRPRADRPYACAVRT